MKKLTSILLAAALLLCLAACGSPGAEQSQKPVQSGQPQVEGNASPAPEGEDAKVYKVGILQQLEHQALDAATEGFRAALTEKLGENVQFDYQNAQNDGNNCTTIANKFVTDGVDLIMANATTALQAAASATAEIPVVGASITDYITAGVLLGGNVTGASDLAPIDQQIELLLELCPEAETVGILYCSGEANSIYQAEKATEYLEAAGIAVKEYTVAESNEIQPVLSGAVEEIDVLYIPTDNTLADNMELVKNITVPVKCPVVTGEENMCGVGALATLSISYYDMGYAAGELACSILTGEADPATSPIVYVSEVTRKYNPEVAELIGWTIPEGIEAIG